MISAKEGGLRALKDADLRQLELRLLKLPATDLCRAFTPECTLERIDAVRDMGTVMRKGAGAMSSALIDPDRDSEK